ncbi:MAG TPA: alpha/beta hydrolase-fold protein [Candidatus Sulfomarinibacteraceae bacterium]|nr:alpha/beta hydrolase-fold protein [Candidatus Sulfomarinibacteraceae bacterium]
MVTLRAAQRQVQALALIPILLVLVACSAPPAPTTVATAALPTASPARTLPQPTATPTAAPPTAGATPRATATGTSTPAPETDAGCSLTEHDGAVVDGVFYSATAGADHTYRLYLPPCYEEDGRRYPTLYLLAGNIHDHTKWDELGADEAAETLLGAQEIAPLLIVMPDGGWLANNTSGGPGSYESLILDELIPHIEAELCAWADPRGRAIGGLSRGGYWALEIAFRFPQLFASVGGHSAALLDEYAGPQINPQSTALSNDLGDLRIYLDIGADDYLRANTIQLHQDMEAAGVPHTWLLNEGRHEDVYWAAQVEEYIRWYADGFSGERDSYPPCE